METPRIQREEKSDLIERGGMTDKPHSDRPESETRFDTGMAVRRAVLGDAHVDRAESAKTAFDEPFQTLITEGAWGSVWAGEQLTRRERSIVTLALLAALGHEEEVAMHVRATENTGASPDDVREALMHVAIYAGVPAANRAFKRVKQTYAEMGITFDETGEKPE